MDINCQSDATDEEDVCDDAERLRLESPVMPRLHLAVKSRSADELTPGKELHAVRNEGGCSPTSSIRGSTKHIKHIRYKLYS
jgi:hypothetical protein